MALTGGAIMEGLDAVHSDPEMHTHFFQSEAGAAWAAMGYARTTGNVGVCIVTSGPGATNTISAVADARRDNVPMLVVTGQVPTTARNTDAFQETNITEIAAPTSKAVYYLNRAEEIASTLVEAFRIVRQGRPGPVLIDFTKDVQQAVISAERFEELESLVGRSETLPAGESLPERELEEAARLLEKSQRPVLLLGYGAVLAGIEDEIEAMLEQMPCPVVHTLPGKPAIRSDHPLNFGMLGMHGFYVANWLIRHADLVISLGSRFDDRITGDTARFAPGARRLVHFDISEEQVGKVLPERKLGVVGNLRQTFPAFRESLRDLSPDRTEWFEEITRAGKKHPSSYQKRDDILQAQFVIETLNEVVGAHTERTGRQIVYAAEVGDHQMWSGQYLRLETGWGFLTSSGQGAMGSGLPMAIGAQLANPRALVVCLAGDGSLRMSEAELETIVEYDLPVKIILFNNSGYGIVRMWNHRFYGGRETGVVKNGKNWRLLARANGFSENQVGLVSSPEDLRDQLQGAIEAPGPAFLEMQTPYEECLPLMPRGSPSKTSFCEGSGQ